MKTSTSVALCAFLASTLSGSASAFSILSAQYATEAEGSNYTLSNNLWGQYSSSGAAYGSQSTEAKSLSGGVVGWETTYSWAGASNQVKSYANIGLKTGETLNQTSSNGSNADEFHRAPGLGVALSSIKSIPTTWKWTYTKADSDLVADVSYDLWLSKDASCGQAVSCSTVEIMVWLSTRGGAGPAGTYSKTVTVGAASYKLYIGTVQTWSIHRNDHDDLRCELDDRDSDSLPPSPSPLKTRPRSHTPPLQFTRNKRALPRPNPSPTADDQPPTNRNSISSLTTLVTSTIDPYSPSRKQKFSVGLVREKQTQYDLDGLGGTGAGGVVLKGLLIELDEEREAELESEAGTSTTAVSLAPEEFLTPVADDEDADAALGSDPDQLDLLVLRTSQILQSAQEILQSTRSTRAHFSRFLALDDSLELALRRSVEGADEMEDRLEELNQGVEAYAEGREDPSGRKEEKRKSRVEEVVPKMDPMAFLGRARTPHARPQRLQTVYLNAESTFDLPHASSSPPKPKLSPLAEGTSPELDVAEPVPLTTTNPTWRTSVGVLSKIMDATTPPIAPPASPTLSASRLLHNIASPPMPSTSPSRPRSVSLSYFSRSSNPPPTPAPRATTSTSPNSTLSPPLSSSRMFSPIMEDDGDSSPNTPATSRCPSPSPSPLPLTRKMSIQPVASSSPSKSILLRHSKATSSLITSAAPPHLSP
ncbi:hypothetical protein P7C70_g8349, partial [Phenoliferia sp. Uapishka_3]